MLDLKIRETNVWITTLGGDPDPALVDHFSRAPRKSTSPAHVVDVQKSPTLDEWEWALDCGDTEQTVVRNRTKAEVLDRLNDPTTTLPDLLKNWHEFQWVQNDLDNETGFRKPVSFGKVSTATRTGKFQTPHAVLLRPGVSVPDSPAAKLVPAAFPFPGDGRWHTTEAPKYGPTFSPGWKFPQWIRANLPKLKNGKDRYSFNDLSEAGFDTLLAEYAGLVDRGNGFKLDPASPICQNLQLYLRRRYGGTGGLQRKIAVWLDATEAGYRSTPRTADELLIPGATSRDGEGPVDSAGNRKLYGGGLYGTKDGTLLTPDGRDRLPFAEFETADKVLWDSCFMGGTDDPVFANTEVTRFSFVDPTSHKRLRKYHEGSSRLKSRRMRIDDDPSDMTTVGQVRSAGDIRRRLEIIPPEGTVFFEPDEWTPGPEHQALIIQTLFAGGQTHPVDEDFSRPSGYWKVTTRWPNGRDLFPEELHEFRVGKLTGPVSKILFVPTKAWNGTWDKALRRRVPGFGESLPPAERKTWTRCAGGIEVKFRTADWTEDRSLFFRNTEQPDALLSRSALRDLQDRWAAGEDFPPQALAKFLVPVKPTEKNPEGGWRKPYSFEGRDGKTVRIIPRPPIFDRTTWRVYLRSWTALESVRKLLAEERWEKLAFDLDPVGSEDAHLAHLVETDTKVTPAEAGWKIKAHLESLEAQVRQACPTDVADQFDRDVAEVRDMVIPVLKKTREVPTDTGDVTAQTTFTAPPPRKVQAEDAVHAQILAGWRAIFAAAKQTKTEAGDQMAQRILWAMRGRAGVEPAGPPLPATPREFGTKSVVYRTITQTGPAAVVTAHEPPRRNVRRTKNQKLSLWYAMTQDETIPLDLRLKARTRLVRLETRLSRSAPVTHDRQGRKKKVTPVTV